MTSTLTVWEPVVEKLTGIEASPGVNVPLFVVSHA